MNNRKYYLKFVTLIIASLISFSANAQDTDAELKWFRNFFGSKKSKPSETPARLQKKLTTASENHNLPAELRALQELGLVHLTQTHDYEQSMDFLIRALAIGDSLHLQQQQVFTCLAIARVFDEVGNYYKSAGFLEQAFSISKSLGDPQLQVYVLNELGNINTSMERIPDAFTYYEQVLEYKDQIRQPAVEADALFNIGHLYQLQRTYSKALDFQKQALTIRRSLGDKFQEAVTLNSIGDTYAAMGNPAKEIANHQAALEIRQRIGDKRGIAESSNQIGFYYYRHKDYKKSMSLLRSALKSAQESQDQEQLSKTYDYLSQCLQSTGNFKEALVYKDLLVKMNEFIDHEKNEQRLLEAQNRYSLGKKQTLIENLQRDQNRREKELSDAVKLRNGLLTLIGLTILVVILILWLYINKRKTNTALTAIQAQLNQQNVNLTELNATKDKFFGIIGHDLKGPLNSLSSFSNLLSNHIESLTQEEIKMLAKDLDKQLKNLFSLLENLLEWSRSQTGAIEFTAAEFNLTDLMTETRELLHGQAQTKRITIEGPEQLPVLVNAHKQSVQTVVRNLISNSIKFTQEGGLIALGIKTEAGHLVVSIADTGVGMSEDIIKKLFRIGTKHSTKGTANEKGTGLGLILCKDFVEKNGGRIWVESEVGKGSSFFFTLPLHKGI